ncbi:DNA methyltransferase, partial [Candidatus Micrarchaeota archaeon]
NVFDIQQGVAIAFFVKRAKGNGVQTCVHHADLWGSRDEKYAWLSKHDWKHTPWQELHPGPGFYLFIPTDERALEQYNAFPKITDIFPLNVIGIQTHRDHFVIDFDREALKHRIRTFLDPSLPDELVRETFGLKDTRDWRLVEKRRLLQEDKDWEKKIVPCLYRPFDIRWLFYHRHAIDFSREKVMRHLLDVDNVALLVNRRTHELDWKHAFVTRCPASAVAVEVKAGCYVMPLRLLPGRPMEEEAENVARGLLEILADRFGKRCESSEILAYVYAVLYSNTYREKYAEFLRIDFPRIPFTADYELFKRMVELGKRLVDLHLLRSPELDPPIARFQGEGDGKVESGKRGLRYDPENERVYINETQYFEGVPPEVWEYRIGGYQGCHKWLKDRKGRVLSLDEIRTYCHIVTALTKTIEIQDAIDKLYHQVEKELLTYAPSGGGNA